MYEACCTCAKLLSDDAAHTTSDKVDEKPSIDDGDDRRDLPCCGRIICGKCIHTNPRFKSYCPYCQVTSGPSALPQGLREPPVYTSTAFDPRLQLTSVADAPPPYLATAAADDDDDDSGPVSAEKTTPSSTLHFLDHARDTVSSLSLRYGVPAAELRAANQLTSDHLLAARRTVLIPGPGIVSLSPRPVEGEAEEARKAKIRRFMVVAKVPDYEVAVLYLEHAAYDADQALEAYLADEAWEREHPLVEARDGRMERPGPRPGPWARTLGNPGGARATQTAFRRL